MLITLVALLVGVVAVLAIPVGVTFTVQREEKFQGRVTIDWLFGLVRIPVQPEENGETKPEPSSKKSSRTQAQRDIHLWAMFRSKGFLARLLRLLRRLMGCIHIRRLRLHLLIGLDDPADTGQLWGMIGPLALLVPVPARAELVIQPEFTGAALQIDSEGAIRILPIEIIGTLFAFALSPVTLRALYALGTGR